MNTTVSTLFDNYTPVGDILVLAICLTFVVLIDAAYVNRTKAFQIYRIMLALLALAAVTDLCFYVAALQPKVPSHALLYILRVTFHAALFGNLFLYVFYIAEIMHLSRAEQRKYVIVGALGYAAMGLYEALGIVLRYGFYIDEDMGIHTGFPVFPFTYIFFVGLILYMAVSAVGFEDSIRYHHQRGQELLIISLFLPELEGSGRKYPEGLTKTIRYFATCFFNGAVMFQTSGGRMILVMETSKNPNHEDTVRAILEKFHEAHEKVPHGA